MLHKLVKLIHVDVRKELGGKVADRYPFSTFGFFTLSLSLSLSLVKTARKTPDNFFKQPVYFRILDSPQENLDECGVVNRVEELLYIALQDKAPPRMVSAHGANRICKKIYATVRPLSILHEKEAGINVGSNTGFRTLNSA